MTNIKNLINYKILIESLQFELIMHRNSHTVYLDFIIRNLFYCDFEYSDNTSA